MKKIVLVASLVLVVALGGAFLFFKGKGYEFAINQEQVDAALEKKFPVTKKFLLIFELTYSNPQVKLLETDNRVQVGLDAVLDINIKGESKKLSGTCKITSEVSYNSDTHEFFLAESVFDRLEIEGIPEKYLEKVTQAASVAARKYLEEFPVYKIQGKDGKMAAAKLLLKDLEIRDQTIYVTMGL